MSRACPCLAPQAAGSPPPVHTPAKAAPAPPVGPALGQAGLNIMEFCKAFNAETQQMEQGAPLPVVITVYQDKTFSFVYKKIL